MIRLFPSTFARCIQPPAPLAAPVDFGSVDARVRLGLALRFCVAAVFGLAIVVGAIGVWAAAAVAIAVVGDTPSRRSLECSAAPHHDGSGLLQSCGTWSPAEAALTLQRDGRPHAKRQGEQIGSAFMLIAVRLSQPVTYAKSRLALPRLKRDA
jgi:hypothetical protein